MTEVAKTNVITEPSLITAKRLTAHKIVVKDTGEVIRMTNDHRMVYSHLEDQFRGLTNPKNIAAGKSTGHYYDSYKNLEIRCDVKNTTFKKVKKDLKALGLIHWEKPKARKSGHSCEYFVKPVDEVAPNLEFIFQELPNGKPSYDHERVSGQKTKKSNQQMPKPASRGDVNEVVNPQAGCTDEEAEQQDPQAKQAATAATPPADQVNSLAVVSAEDASKQRSGVASNEDSGGDDGTTGNHEVKPQEPEIFDDRGVITEVFINSLTGGYAPHRNADGTLQSFRYVYWVARHLQDERDGITVRTREEYMAEAQPWHIPPHLLSTPTPKPEYDEDPKF